MWRDVAHASVVKAVNPKARVLALHLSIESMKSARGVLKDSNLVIFTQNTESYILNGLSSEDDL